MVKIQGSSEYDKLDGIVQEACSKHGFKLQVTGWARKTYDIFFEEKKTKKLEHVARVESFATTSGEIRVFDDRALPFAQDLGQALESAFKLTEAVVIREKRPE
ncbi:MAG: hypothetical protein HYU36_15430 [Planctomycetes bacterium]|nr:hypothetical protein [Planctomycetota bacterium]